MKTKLHWISLAMCLLLAAEASSKQALEEDQPSLPPGEEAEVSTTAGEETNGTPYQHFIALNHSQTCIGDEHATPFNNQIRGVNLGGWMVLEPWITPTMFYQFLDGNETSTAFDTYTFCQVLGGAEANRQLRNHWGKIFVFCLFLASYLFVMSSSSLSFCGDHPRRQTLG